MDKKFLIDEFEAAVSLDIKEIILECSKIADREGINIYLIGGAVRDLLLCSKVFNIDIVLESDAIKFCEILVKELNAQISYKQVDLRTAKIVFKNAIEIDFASTRKEEYPIPGELPKVIEVGCPLKEDLSRRDFTVNTMVIGLNSHNWCEFIDYFDGCSDLKAGKIKILHEKSFIDDPSRIVRGLKFAVRLGFDLEENTLKLQNEYLKKINRNMPLERVRSEIEQLFSLNCAKAYDEFIKQKLYLIIAKNPNLETKGEGIEEKLRLFEIIKDEIWLVYLGCLLISEDISNLKRLNLNSKQIKNIFDVSELLNTKTSSSNDKYTIYKFFEGKNQVSLAIYYILSDDPDVFIYLKELKDIKLLVSGDDLISMGLEPSPDFKKILDEILKEKINNNLATKEDEVIYLKKLLHSS